MFFVFRGSVVVACLLLIGTTMAQEREWTDAKNGFVFEAEFVGSDDHSVVVRRADGELAMLKIEQLSDEDREFLKSKEAQDTSNRNIRATQTWKTKTGLELAGRIVDFVRGDMVVHRRRFNLYINDRRFRNLPELYQKLLPKIIEHFDGTEIPDDRALRNWETSLGRNPRTFHIEGVVLEAENGDEYSIPFFVFNDQDQKLLKSGWSQWVRARDEYELRAEQAFRLEALAAAHLQNQKTNHQIAMMNLNMQAVNAGITSAWEVTLHPLPGNPRPSQWVVVPARNSADATAIALRDNPGFVQGPVRRLNRRRR
jgi:hypothetical protein